MLIACTQQQVLLRLRLQRGCKVAQIKRIVGAARRTRPVRSADTGASIGRAVGRRCRWLASQRDCPSAASGALRDPGRERRTGCNVGLLRRHRRFGRHADLRCACSTTTACQSVARCGRFALRHCGHFGCADERCVRRVGRCSCLSLIAWHGIYRGRGAGVVAALASASGGSR